MMLHYQENKTLTSYPSHVSSQLMLCINHEGPIMNSISAEMHVGYVSLSQCKSFHLIVVHVMFNHHMYKNIKLTSCRCNTYQQVTLIPMYLTNDIADVVYRQFVALFPGPRPATVTCRMGSLVRADNEARPWKA